MKPCIKKYAGLLLLLCPKPFWTKSKSAKKSNRARNPNAQKIARHQPFEELSGLIMVVNAEKVILDRLDLGDQLQLIEHTEDEQDRQANELRNLISKIPKLSISIDEVHHAATDDIKLRQVVNRWNTNVSANSVIGYSGTPCLSKPDSIAVGESLALKFSQINNTVHYYPLVRAIQGFLKKPRVEVATGLEPLKLPPVEFRQLKVIYENVTVEDDPDTAAKLDATRQDKGLYSPATITRRDLNPDDPGTKTFIETMGSEPADFRRWLGLIVKESFNTLLMADVRTFEAVLQEIYSLITFEDDGERRFNELYDQHAVRAAIRLAFHKRRELLTRSEVIPEHARLLLVEKLGAVEPHANLYPNAADCVKIVEIDQTGVAVQTVAAQGEELQRMFLEFLKQQGKEQDLVARMNMPQVESYS